jgi:type IV secretion system protein VirD4
MWQNLLLGALVALAGLTVLVWLSAGLSALLVGNAWPKTGIGRTGRVVARLAAEPSDPAAAWPRHDRDEIAGPLAFYGVLGAVCAAAATAGLAARRSLRGEQESAEATWASKRDLRALIVKRPPPRRVVLGRVGASLVAAEERQSVIVLGPTQSMKTSGFAIPSILEWQGPVIATSVKTDLIRHTIVERSHGGETWIFDPTASTGVETSAWTPLSLCQDWRGAQRVAAWLAKAANQGGSGLDQAEFWYQSAAKLIAPLLYAAATSGASMSDVVRWVDSQEEQEVAAALRAAGTKEALVAAQASWQREPRQKSSVYTTAEAVLLAYQDPVVARSAARCDFSAAQFLDGGRHTLYVAAPSHEQKRLRPLFQTLVESIVNHAFEFSSRSDGPLDPPLLVVLDEAANIAPLPELDTLASTASSHGVVLVSIFHDLSQIIDRYGERAPTVVNNHRAKIVLSGVSDPRTLDHVSRLLGDEEVMQAAYTEGSRGERSTTSSTTLRNLAPASVLRGIRPGEGILVYGHLLPARLRLRPWFQEQKSLLSLRRPR